MKGLFSGCRHLIRLPDISKWKTDNINDLSELFYDCENLSSLPDISKWKIQNKIKIERMFNGCQSLIKMPDISKWKISPNIINTSSNNFSYSNNTDFSKEIYISSLSNKSNNNSNNNSENNSNTNSNNINSLELIKDFENGVTEENIEYYENFYS